MKLSPNPLTQLAVLLALEHWPLGYVEPCIFSDMTNDLVCTSTEQLCIMGLYYVAKATEVLGDCMTYLQS